MALNTNTQVSQKLARVGAKAGGEESSRLSFALQRLSCLKSLNDSIFSMHKLKVCKDQGLKQPEPKSNPPSKPKREITKITNSQNTHKV